MKRSEAKQIIALLLANYPSMNLPSETVEVWTRNLEPYPRREAQEAARKIVDSSKWFPSWAEFRSALLLGDRKSPDAAWILAHSAMGIIGDEGDPIIREAVKLAGGDWMFRSVQGSYELHNLRENFKAAYTFLVERHTERRDAELLALAVAPPKPEALIP